MKKVIVLLLILALMPFSVIAADKGYPVIPDRLLQISKAMLSIDDTGATVLYEHIEISDEFGAWMVGWFWDDSKTVVGITDKGEIIYYNTAPLGSGEHYSNETNITKEEGYETVLKFLKIIMQGRQWKLKSASAFEYEFSETHNGIPIYGHDATVVVDKSSGKVIYYRGFATYDSTYQIISKMISKDSAFNRHFDNVGIELVYQLKYDDFTKSKFVRPLYILNNKEHKAVDVEDGILGKIITYDYNAYYNENHFDTRFDFDNDIRKDEPTFLPTENIETTPDVLPIEIVQNAFTSLSSGYAFVANPGIFEYYKSANTDNKVPVWQVNIVPSVFKDGINRFSTMYDVGEHDWLKTANTKKQFCFARAYVNAITGEILEFKSIVNDKYPGGNVYRRNVAIERFLKLATNDYDSLKFYGKNDINSYISEFGYARYENGCRVIGEGAVFTYNNKIGDMTEFYLNMNSDIDVLYGIKTIEEMKEIIKENVPYEIVYVDKSPHTKYPVYDFRIKDASFDPVTGNMVNKISNSEINTIFTCNIGSKSYIINGQPRIANAPVAHDNKVYLPIRFFSQEFGYTVLWQENSLILESGKNIITIYNDNTYDINGTVSSLQSPSVTIEGVKYISLNDICLIFGTQSSWDDDTQSIYILN